MLKNEYNVVLYNGHWESTTIADSSKRHNTFDNRHLRMILVHNEILYIFV